jgi:hypothetical protein
VGGYIATRRLPGSEVSGGGACRHVYQETGLKQRIQVNWHTGCSRQFLRGELKALLESGHNRDRFPTTGTEGGAAMTSSVDFVFVRCNIERGGFSSERTFEIELADGDRVVGTANVQHFLDNEGRPLDDDVPPFGVTLHGMVRCRVIEQIDERTAIVDIPSFDLVEVPRDSITELCSLE